MKKKLLILVILLSTLFISCTKIPFTPKKPQNDLALIYVYTVQSPAHIEGDTRYKVYIDGKSTKGFLHDSEFVTYDMKPVPIRIAGSRNDIERHALELDLKAGEIYYFKLQIIGDGFGEFDFTQVDATTALEELKETTLAEAYDTTQNVITSLVTEDTNKKQTLNNTKKTVEKSTQTSASSTSSKLDDIKNAYEMKKEGLLTEEEFKAMKAEILAK